MNARLAKSHLLGFLHSFAHLAKHVCFLNRKKGCKPKPNFSGGHLSLWEIKLHKYHLFQYLPLGKTIHYMTVKSAGSADINLVYSQLNIYHVSLSVWLIHSTILPESQVFTYTTNIMWTVATLVSYLSMVSAFLHNAIKWWQMKATLHQNTLNIYMVEIGNCLTLTLNLDHYHLKAFHGVHVVSERCTYYQNQLSDIEYDIYIKSCIKVLQVSDS